MYLWSEKFRHNCLVFIVGYVLPGMGGTYSFYVYLCRAGF